MLKYIIEFKHKIGDFIKLTKKIKLYVSESGSLRYEVMRRLFRKKNQRLLLERKNPKYFNHTARRINRIMKGKEFTYLEIGVADGTTIQSIASGNKHGVDPNPLFNTEKLPSTINFSKLTSDEFFSTLDKSCKFDFIFIDGLHEINQLTRDFFNSLRHLTIGGWILIDDIVPCDSISALSSINESYEVRGVNHQEGYPWHGNCYKLLNLVLQVFPNIASFLILYPDNPQLLLHLDKNITNLELISSEKIQEILELDYEQVFASSNLKTYPIYIEELLMNHLVKLNLIYS